MRKFLFYHFRHYACRLAMCAAVVVCGTGDLLLSACSSGGNVPGSESGEKPSAPFAVSVEVVADSLTSFAVGDQGGLFMVCRSEGQPSGHTVVADNVLMTYRNGWQPVSRLLWKDMQKLADFYFYAPYNAQAGSLMALPVSVFADQSDVLQLRASDIVMAKALDVKPASAPVRLTAKHVMSRLCVRLLPGSGFTAESLGEASQSVSIVGMSCSGMLNLSTGELTPMGEADTVKACATPDGFLAYLLPQSQTDSLTILIHVNGQPFQLRQRADFKSGMQYSAAFTVARNQKGVGVDLTQWDDDGQDYGGVATR